MPFFKGSFSTFGEALKTVSLAIGLFMMATGGIGYLYNMVSEQKAMASEIDVVQAQIVSLQNETKSLQLDRYRLQKVEESTSQILDKMDLMQQSISDLRVLVEAQRP